MGTTAIETPEGEIRWLIAAERSRTRSSRPWRANRCSSTTSRRRHPREPRTGSICGIEYLRPPRTAVDWRVEAHREGMERLSWQGSFAVAGNTLRYCALLRRLAGSQALTNIWTDLGRRIRRRQHLCRPDEHQGRRALHADGDRSRRPRARPDLRCRDNGIRRRAVGATLDHDRHLARCSGAGSPAPDDEPDFPYYLLLDFQRAAARRAKSR